MRADDGRPLEKELIAAVVFILADMIVGVRILETKAVELADVPGEERRIADRFLSRAREARRVVEEKSRRPSLVELELRVAVAAHGRAPLRHIVGEEPLVVHVELGAEREPLVNGAAERLV